MHMPIYAFHNDNNKRSWDWKLFTNAYWTLHATRYQIPNTLAYNFLNNNNRRMNESTNYFNIYSIINATEICWTIHTKKFKYVILAVVGKRPLKSFHFAVRRWNGLELKYDLDWKRSELRANEHFRYDKKETITIIKSAHLTESIIVNVSKRIYHLNSCLIHISTLFNLPISFYTENATSV